MNLEKNKMKTLDSYLGINAFTVEIDDSQELSKLVSEARAFRELSFKDKLQKVKSLAVNAMENAYEQEINWRKEVEELKHTNEDIDDLLAAGAQQQKYYSIVYETNPLSFALQNKAGCCRYQGALFFVLGYEAKLGDRHFIQAAPVKPGVNSVFNQVYNGDELHNISIFLESLKDKSLDYSVQNPRIFEEPFQSLKGFNFYSYHKTPQGRTLVENSNEHINKFGEEK